MRVAARTPDRRFVWLRVREQAQEMEAAGVRPLGSPRAHHADAARRGRRRRGHAALADIERRWRELLGESAYSTFVSALARLNLER